MNNHGDGNTLAIFLKKITTSITAVIGTILCLYSFIKLFSEKNAELFTGILIVFGICLPLATCLYYAFVWKPEQKDQEQLLLLSGEAQQNEIQKQEKRNHKTRLTALVILFVLPVIYSSIFGVFHHIQSLPPKEIVVLVADFDGPDPKKFRVTETVINRLRKDTEKYSDVKIKALNESITEQDGSEVARAKGKKEKATIVTWGWYSNARVAPVYANIELLSDKKTQEPEQSTRLQYKKVPITSLENFTLQDDLSSEMSSVSLFWLGMIRYTATDWDGAIGYFSDTLNAPKDIAPALNHSLVYLQRGLTYLEKKDYDRTLTDLNQAINLVINLEEPPLDRLIKAYSIRGEVHSQKGDYDLAISDYDWVLKQDSDNFAAYINRGIVYANKGNYERAIADISQAIKIKPNSDSAYFNRAKLYSLKKNYDLAITDLKQIIKLKLSQDILIEAYRGRGEVHSQKGDYDLAISDYSWVLKQDPDNFAAYHNRGGSYSDKGDDDLAIADYKRAIELNPNFAWTYNSLGCSLKRKSDYDQAIFNYKKAIELKSDYAEAYGNLGSTYQEKGDYDHALIEYNRAIELEPDIAAFYSGRGYTYALKGDYNLALEDANQALKLEPNSPEAYNIRGLVSAGKGDLDQAINDHNQAIKQIENNGAVTSDIKKGTQNIYLSITYDVDRLYYDRGLAYRQKGKKDKAISDFKKALELTKKTEIRQDTEKQLKELGIS
jgi:tetratricopeptide (TPR) repeat protein